MPANNEQPGGDHYKRYGDLQPWDLWELWDLDGYQCDMLKRIIRNKGSIEDRILDMQKVQHVAEKYKEVLKTRRGKVDKVRQQLHVVSSDEDRRAWISERELSVGKGDLYLMTPFIWAGFVFVGVMILAAILL